MTGEQRTDAAAYFRPTSVQEAWRYKAEVPAARYVAGGTDLLAKLRGGRCEPCPVISLRNIDALRQIVLHEAGASIGGACTISSLLEHSALMSAYPLLQQAARRLGSVQVRNVATVAGNLCNASPCADLAPPLLALEARLVLDSPGGARRVALWDFFLGRKQTCLRPEEIVTSVELERSAPDARSLVLRCSRVHMDLALVSVAALLRFEGRVCREARLAAGAVSPCPMRLRGVEQALAGQPVDEALLARLRALASEEVSPISDVRTTAAYRRHLTGVFVERAVRTLAAAGSREQDDA